MFYTLYLHSPPKGLFLYMIYLIYILLILLVVSLVLFHIFISIERYDLAIKALKVVFISFFLLISLAYI